MMIRLADALSHSLAAKRLTGSRVIASSLLNEYRNGGKFAWAFAISDRARSNPAAMPSKHRNSCLRGL